MDEIGAGGADEIRTAGRGAGGSGHADWQLAGAHDCGSLDKSSNLLLKALTIAPAATTRSISDLEMMHGGHSP